MERIWVAEVELREAIGTDAARTLCLYMGGVSTYIPKTPRARHAYAPYIGMQALTVLCQVYGGMEIQIPNANDANTKKREIITLLEEGGRSMREIALASHASQRWVEMVAREWRLSRRPSARSHQQLSLPL